MRLAREAAKPRSRHVILNDVKNLIENYERLEGHVILNDVKNPIVLQCVVQRGRVAPLTMTMIIDARTAQVLRDKRFWMLLGRRNIHRILASICNLQSAICNLREPHNDNTRSNHQPAR